MRFIEAFEQYVSRSPSDEIQWDALEKLFAESGFSEMRNTPQNPVYHGEGDVFTHTQLVCQSLNGMAAFHALPGKKKTALFLAAVLHDLGKIRTTRLEDGAWTSPYHSVVGSQMARAFLWRECGLCGTEEALSLREGVCALIRYHMLPAHLLEKKEPERTAREVAALGERAKDFSWELLCMLGEADIRGRITKDTEEKLSKVQLCRMMAEEAGCLSCPFPFPDAFTKRAYLSGRNVPPDQPLFDDTWGEIVLLSGLPGTGKDAWIRRNLPDVPVISLDAIRKELRIDPKDRQGEVIQAAQERARECLRRKQPFIWNATNLTRDTRQRVVKLCEQYGARARIVYLETDWNERIRRNGERKDAVPESAVEGMLEKTVPPQTDEAQTVEWIGV